MTAPLATAAEIRAAIQRLPDTHANLKTLIDAVAAYAGESSADTSEVSELLDRASDACAGVYLPSTEDRAQWAADDRANAKQSEVV
jgi:hypothetical protein